MIGRFVGFALLLAAVACKSDAAKQAEAQAEPIATAWLELVDKESYADSWTQAASVFKSAVASEQWQA